MKNRIVAIVTMLVLVLGGMLWGASPVSAHTGNVQGTATCNTDGTWNVIWSFTASNVPDGVEAEVKAMTTSAGALNSDPGNGVTKGGQVFLSVWSEHQVNVPGAPVKTGNWSDKFSTRNIDASVSGVNTQVQWDYKDGVSGDTTGSVTNPGDCDDNTQVSLCHATGSGSNPYVLITVNAAGAYNGHLGAGHQNGEDIIPPFTYNGETYSQNWDEQGQAIFNNGCKAVDEPTVQKKKAWLRLVSYCNTVAVDRRHNIAKVVHKRPNARKHVFVAHAKPNALFNNGHKVKRYVRYEKRGGACGSSSS